MVLYSPHGSSNLLDPEAKQQRDNASVPVQHSIQNDNSVINPYLLRAEYAVRGPITDRAAQIERELATGTYNHDFQKLLYCNIGNPQALGQVPISYGRHLLALCECPELMGSDVSTFFPEDVIAFAKSLKEKIKIGAYTASLGHPELRKTIAAGIEKRDGHAASIDTPQECVVLSNGASASVHYLLQAMIQDSSDAFLVPVPQYPLYSAALSLYGGTLMPYYLDEASGWGVDVDSVEQLIRDSMAKGLRVRGLVVINPGNPTGQVLSQENQRKVVQMCGKMGVPIIADEVYQDNIWASEKTFTSFRKIVLDEFEHLSPVVFSLHSTSKGYLGECGHRGGYMNMLNCPPELLTQLSKLMSISLCSNTPGQILMAAMMNPPEPGKPSYQKFNSQKSAILQSLARRAAKLAKGLRALEGVTCCEPEGALYVFPKLTIPENAKAKALAKNVQPDFLYCLELLEATGIVSVPGSGFGQVEGTFHVRLTILPSEEDIDAMLDLLTRFHASFMAKYSPTAAAQERKLG